MSKKLRPPTQKRSLKERLKGVVEHEKELWKARDERKKAREKKKIEKLLEEEKRLDEKIKKKRIKDRVRKKRAEASPISGLLKGMGKGLERVGKATEKRSLDELPSLDAKPKTKRKKKKKSKTKKRDQYPELPPL